MREKDLKVLHIVNSFVGKKGNIGVRTAKLVNFGERAGISSVVVCRGKDKDFDHQQTFTMGVFGHLARVLNAFRIYIYNSFDHRTWDLWFFECFVLLWLKFNLKPGHVDIVHLWDFSPNIIKAVQQRGLKVVLDVAIVPQCYTQKIQSKNQALFLDFSKRHCKQELLAMDICDWIMAPSVFVKNEIVEAGIDEGKIRVVPFGSDSPYHQRQVELGSTGLHFAFVGLVNRRKGVDDLLTAWSCDDFRNDKLHLCGRVYPEISKLVKDYGLANVVLAGHVDPFEYLLGCDVFVFPTWMEGSAKAVYEALAVGLPVVTTPCAGSVVEDGKDGFIVPPGNVESIREKLLCFKKDRKLLSDMAEKAKSTGRYYTWNRYAKSITEFYREWDS